MSLVNMLLADAGDVKKGGPGSGRKPGGGTNQKTPDQLSTRANGASKRAEERTDRYAQSGSDKDLQSATNAHIFAANAHLEASNAHAAAGN